MRAVDFDNIEPGLGGAFGCGTEAADDAFDVVLIHNVDFVVGGESGDVGNELAGVAGNGGLGQTPGVVELDARLAAVGVDGVREPAKAFDEVIGSDAHAGPIAFARIVHTGGFEHVEPHAAVGALGVVGDEALADFAVDRAVVRDH